MVHAAFHCEKTGAKLNQRNAYRMTRKLKRGDTL